MVLFVWNDEGLVFISILPKTDSLPQKICSGPQKERIVSQPLFFRGERVSFQECTDIKMCLEEIEFIPTWKNIQLLSSPKVAEMLQEFLQQGLLFPPFLALKKPSRKTTLRKKTNETNTRIAFTNPSEEFRISKNPIIVTSQGFFSPSSFPTVFGFHIEKAALGDSACWDWKSQLPSKVQMKVLEEMGKLVGHLCFCVFVFWGRKGGFRKKGRCW